MDIQALAEQFRGRRFGELILHHHKKQDLPTIIAALQGTLADLPDQARARSEQWIDEIAPLGAREEFWQRDCGEAFLDICQRARSFLEALGTRPTNDDLFNMFQIITLNFAYGAHQHPQSKAFIQKAIGIGFLGRLFR